ncbi:flippase [Xenorhabdus szentirmaii]|uniref:flippase n=1 Tax=Xenorhabdus szentirmaii TaxID=290112 RepID=UPI0019CDFEA1|nr:flippase [Xenorhabdus sp. 38]MBD2781296.1 flippase [Xenorhabdus sp. 38]
MKKIIFNSIWLLLERLINIIGNLLVTIYVARYLGPNNMGIINFSLAISALIIPITQLGGDITLFNKAAQKEVSAIKLLKATNNLRLIICFILIIISISYFYIMREDSTNIFVLILMMMACLFSSLDLYRIFFDAISKSKLNSIATQMGVYISLIVRFIFVKLNLSLIYFTIPFILSSLIPFFIRLFYFSNQQKKYTFPKIRKQRDKIYIKYFIFTGIPLTLSSLSIVFYTKINQIFIGEYLDMSAVAIFSAAMTIAQGWSFIPISIVTVMFAHILKNKKIDFQKGIVFLYFIVFLISIPIIFMIHLYNDSIIYITYGKQYSSASEILGILAISSLFSVVGTISYRTIVTMGGYKFIMYKMFIIAMFNVLLNIYMIREYGIIGAAYSTLITEIVSATIANFIFRNGIIFKLIISAPVSLKSFIKE